MVQFGRPSLVHFRRHIPVQLRPSLDIRARCHEDHDAGAQLLDPFLGLPTAIHVAYLFLGMLYAPNRYLGPFAKCASSHKKGRPALLRRAP